MRIDNNVDEEDGVDADHDDGEGVASAADNVINAKRIRRPRPRLIVIRYRFQLFLRYMIILSFLFSTIALTWFTTKNYTPHNNTNSKNINNNNNKHQEQEQDGSNNANDNTTNSNFDFNHVDVQDGNGTGNGEIMKDRNDRHRHLTAAAAAAAVPQDDEGIHNHNENENSTNRGGGGENKHEKKDGKEEGEQKAVDVSLIVYIIGSSWWILTGTLIYLSPILISMIDQCCCATNIWKGICFWKITKTSSTRMNGTTARKSSIFHRGRGGTGIWDGVNIDDGDEEEEQDDTEQSDIDVDFDHPVAIVNNEPTIPSRSSSFSRRFSFTRWPIKTWRIILVGLIILPSLWVFLYGTYNGIPRARMKLQQTISDNEDHNDNDQSKTSVLDWTKIIIMASARPAGTAGMVAMGIYVFGTIGKHCPLWSSYILMPSKPHSNNTNNSNNSFNANTNHLMHDALRLHQWAGYTSFAWIIIHSLCYILIYGFKGIVRGQQQEDQVQNDDNENGVQHQQHHQPSYYVWIFIRSSYQALIPPVECRPWYQNSTPTTNNDGDDRLLQLQQHQNGGHGSSCYGVYRNFYGLIGTLSFLLLVITSLSTMRRKSYRFFYISHIVFVIMFVLATIIHMKNNILYLLPSIIFYLSTTIPTLIQQLIQSLPSFDYWLSFSSLFRCNDNNVAGGGGGVQIDEYILVSSSSQSSTLGDDDNSNNADDDGCECVELTFSVDERISPLAHISGSNTYDTKSSSVSASSPSYRPKSVKICIPSISLLWHPFTIIETETTSGPVQFKILFKKVGYFTTAVLNRLKLHKEQQREETEHRRIRSIENGNAGGRDFLGDGRESRTQLYLPLILVDGFYSGTSDWIANALNHDVVLVAAGGVGVTPFLTFLPILLKEFLSSTDNDGDGDGNRNDKLSTLKTVSLLWCCRDEALIKHVIRSYLLPLFHYDRHTILGDEDGCGGGFKPNINCVRFKLIIFNTSRDRNDKHPFELFGDNGDEGHSSASVCPNISSSRRDIFRDEIISEEEDTYNQENHGHHRTSIFAHTTAITGCADAGGYPMRPSKFYHDPLSSPSTAVIASISFLSVSALGMLLHRWLYFHYILENTHQFFVRPYGLFVVLLLSIVVGFVVDVFWRYWLSLSSSSTRRYKKGYTATKVDSELALVEEGDDDKNSNGITSRINNNNNNNSFCGDSDGKQNNEEYLKLRSLSPGKPHRKVVGTSSRSIKKVLLELKISNGRPILFNEAYDDENNADEVDEDEDSNNDSINAYTTSAAEVAAEAMPIMRSVVKAERPGVFYCGPEGLLDTIKSGVHKNRRRRRDTEGDKNNDKIANCVFYEESFEM
jgi:hypothetical protein